MKIRDEQMAVLATPGDRAFEQRVMDFLSERHASAVGHRSPEVLREHVKFALATGRAHGLTWQSALVGFCVLMFEVGPNFYLHPAFKRALAIRLPNENKRIEAIYANTTDEDWEDAREFADPDGWQGPNGSTS